MPLDAFILTAGAGLLATYALIITALWAPRVGLPRIDFSRAMADLYWADSFDGRGPYWMGFAIIHVNGIIFALVYATEIGAMMPAAWPGVVKGAVWGEILYIFAELVFVPIFLRGGIFSVKAHKMAWLTSFIVHGAWGCIVGWLSPVL